MVQAITLYLSTRFRVMRLSKVETSFTEEFVLAASKESWTHPWKFARSLFQTTFKRQEFDLPNCRTLVFEIILPEKGLAKINLVTHLFLCIVSFVLKK